LSFQQVTLIPVRGFAGRHINFYTRGNVPAARRRRAENRDLFRAHAKSFGEVRVNAVARISATR